ncbi:adenosine deaminase [Paragonimus westermani]|uniref:adenosine deaminase n=1 Tax=Paragonimus westermani TaxID=34504 RepID=A0A5J4NE14_9TREM|nr:adenosine deaminase [Paragonimus westermani]
MFLQSGYPERFVDKTMERREKQDKMTLAEKKTIFISLPFKGDTLAETITRRLNTALNRTFYAANLREAIARITAECVEDCATRSGLCYVELRFSPHLLVGSKLSPDDVVATVLNTSKQAGDQHGVQVRLILCILRSRPDTADSVLELAVKYKRKGVVAIDLSGDDSVWLENGIPIEVVNVFQRAKALGIHRTVHAGENSPADAVLEAIELLHAERIGHGYSTVNNLKVFDFVRKNRIHLEVSWCIKMVDCLRHSEDAGVDLLPGERLTDLDYADDKVLLFDNFQSAQAMLDAISRSAKNFGMRFAASKCKVFLQDCSNHVDLMLDNVVMKVVDRFVYLGSCISVGGGGVGNEIEARISKARTVFANLGHLWRQRGISLKLKGRVYKTTVRAVLLYGSETWPLRVEDVNRLQVFDHRCLRSIARIGWHQRNVTVAMEANAQFHYVPRTTSYHAALQHFHSCSSRGCLNVKIHAVASPLNSSGEDLALNRTAWRNTVRAGVRKFNAQLLRGRERKRRGDVTIWRCDVCGRECAGRLGLVGHQRTHSTPSAKRRRVR